MSDRDLEGLSPAAGRRLDRFAAEFERLSAGDYALFAVQPEEDAALAEALQAANAALGSAARRKAAAAAVTEFVEWASQGYSRRLAMPDTILLYQALPDRPDDRLRLRRALEAAVIGLVAWDDLGEGDRSVLVGPFAEMAARAAAG